MNIAALVQAFVLAALTFLASKGLHLAPHQQELLVGGITFIAAYLAPTIYRFRQRFARELGAVAGAAAVGLQLLASQQLGNVNLQAFVTAALTFASALFIPAAAHESMPAPPGA